MLIEAIAGAMFVGSWIITTSKGNALTKRNKEFAIMNDKPYYYDKKGRKRYTKTDEVCVSKFVEGREILVTRNGEFPLVDLTEIAEDKKNIELYNKAKENGDLLWHPMTTYRHAYFCPIEVTPDKVGWNKEWYKRDISISDQFLPRVWEYFRMERLGPKEWRLDKNRNTKVYTVTVGTNEWNVYNTVDEYFSYMDNLKDRNFKEWLKNRRR